MGILLAIRHRTGLKRRFPESLTLPSPLPRRVKFFSYFTCISNSVILLKFIQRIYAYEIII